MVWIASVPKSKTPLTVEPVLRDHHGGIPLRPRTLLIVEDDPTTRLALACMVTEGDDQVILAESAEDALDKLDLIDPDVILCDYLLEGMTGQQFCRQLRASERWRSVPLLMVTRLDVPSVVEDLLRSGANDVLVKPVRGEDLRERVRASLRSCNHAAGVAARTGYGRTLPAASGRLDLFI
jgi:DNA-binding response OmpR family regulator